MKFLFKIVLPIASCLSCLLFTACVPNLKERSAKADLTAQHKGFEKKIIQGGDFFITTYQRLTDQKAPYVFYIESDGFAFYRKTEISENPTPKDSMMLKLASLDTRPNVVYIARPCQYTDPALNPKCTKSPVYWTTARLSEAAVHSIDQVIHSLKNDQPWSLVGYSGGGGIAILLAARNSKSVKDIITIAGNLDIQRFVQDHHAAPMSGSLNPIEYAKQLNHIPQLHLAGGQDNIVRPSIAEAYARASNSTCVHNQILANNTHNKGWQEIWPSILAEKISCHKD